jgi:hypothetical protein
VTTTTAAPSGKKKAKPTPDAEPEVAAPAKPAPKK